MCCVDLECLTFSARFRPELSLVSLSRLKKLSVLDIHSLSSEQAEQLGDALPHIRKLSISPFDYNIRNHIAVLKTLGKTLFVLTDLALECGVSQGTYKYFEITKLFSTSEPPFFPRLEKMYLFHCNWHSSTPGLYRDWFSRNRESPFKVILR